MRMREEQIVRWKELEQSPPHTIAREARRSDSSHKWTPSPSVGSKAPPAKTSWATVTDYSFIF